METNKIILNETNRKVHGAYENMLKILARAAYDKSCEWAKTEPKILFKTNAANMYDSYLDRFEQSDERQHYTCAACAHFFRRFSNIAYVENGKIRSLYWDENLIEDEFFKEMVKSFRIQVESSKIIFPVSDGKYDANTTESILSDDLIYHVYGYDHLGGYNHFHFALNPKGIIYPKKYTTEDAARAYYSRVVKMIKTGWSDNVLNKALNIAKSGDLNNKDSEATFNSFISIREMGKNSSNANLWDLAYKFINVLDHFNGSVEATLLDDISDGHDDWYAISRFNSKMEADKYMRPKSDPSVANVALAEKIVAELDLADSLKRKLCPLDECKSFIWRQKIETDKSSTEGVFGSVKTKDNGDKPDSNYESINSKPVSLQYFINKVLPEAKNIKINCPNTEHYFQYTTEAIPGSNPILKYDTLENRNPISMYTYKHASLSYDFNIASGYNNVVAILTDPKHMISGNTKDGVLFVIENCYDKKIYNTGGLALFPEILIDELYPVRKTIESYSNTNKILEPEPNIQYAAGIFLNENDHIKLVVDTGSVKTNYIIACIE